MAARVTRETVEALVQPATRRARVTRLPVEALVQPDTRRVRVTRLVVEALVPTPPASTLPRRSFVVAAG